MKSSTSWAMGSERSAISSRNASRAVRLLVSLAALVMMEL
jgi:hypothetical protein